MTEPLLRVEDYHLSFVDDQGRAIDVLKGVDLKIEAGEAVALTGSSGCGKSILARAICGLLPATAQIQGKIFWQGQLLSQENSREISQENKVQWQSLRGRGMTLILQEPATSLNPVLTVGHQIEESWALHHPGQKSQARQQCLKLLEEVRLANPLEIRLKYPHQLSGGMRQRVLLATALACEPELLIADEPTTALDPTVQKDVLALLLEIIKRRHMSLLFISHDPQLVHLLTERSYMLEDGQLQTGIFAAGLEQKKNASVAVIEAQNPLQPVLTGKNLVVEYPRSRRTGNWRGGAQGLKAVKGVDLVLFQGQSVGLVGESGCGKTTLARALTIQVPLKSGDLEVAGRDLTDCKGQALRESRRAAQLVFQDPVTSLNPRQRVSEMLNEVLPISHDEVERLLGEVGLGPEIADRFAHQLSGGQSQRVALARALTADPYVLIADEVTSALDPVATKMIVGLLDRIMEQRNLAVLHISHDLDLLHERCHQIMVMSDGIILEVYPGLGQGKPHHPHTLELLRARPNALRADQLRMASGINSTPNADYEMGEGCPWAPFCNEVISSCYKVLPPLVPVGDGHLSRCPVVEFNGSSTFIDTL